MANTSKGNATCANCASSKASDELSLSSGSDSVGATQLAASQMTSTRGTVHSNSYHVPNFRPCQVWAYTKTESQIPKSTRKIAIRPNSDLISRDFVSTARSTNASATMMFRHVNTHQYNAFRSSGRCSLRSGTYRKKRYAENDTIPICRKSIQCCQ